MATASWLALLCLAKVVEERALHRRGEGTNERAATTTERCNAFDSKRAGNRCERHKYPADRSPPAKYLAASLPPSLPRTCRRATGELLPAVCRARRGRRGAVGAGCHGADAGAFCCTSQVSESESLPLSLSLSFAWLQHRARTSSPHNLLNLLHLLCIRFTVLCHGTSIAPLVSCACCVRLIAPVCGNRTTTSSTSP